MTEPKKLPPLASVYKRPYGHFVCEANGDVLPHAEVLEAIRRCEMHDRLVLMLEKATGILEAEFSQQADPSPDDACYVAEQCRAILKENSHGA